MRNFAIIGFTFAAFASSALAIPVSFKYTSATLELQPTSVGGYFLYDFSTNPPTLVPVDPGRFNGSTGFSFTIDPDKVGGSLAGLSVGFGGSYNFARFDFSRNGINISSQDNFDADRPEQSPSGPILAFDFLGAAFGYGGLEFDNDGNLRVFDGFRDEDGKSYFISYGPSGEFAAFNLFRPNEPYVESPIWSTSNQVHSFVSLRSLRLYLSLEDLYSSALQ